LLLRTSPELLPPRFRYFLKNIKKKIYFYRKDIHISIEYQPKERLTGGVEVVVLVVQFQCQLILKS
jgi:hypothetical protein